MSAGRPPKSVEDHKLHGTYREDRHADRAIVESALEESPVEWLTEEEKSIWEKWYHVLQRNEFLKETDDVAFGMLCRVFKRVQDLSLEFQNAESYITTHISDVGSEVKKVDPKYSVLADSEKMLLNLMKEFGMTPVSRNKVKVAIKNQKDPFAELQAM